METVSKTLDAFTNEALFDLVHPGEQGMQIVMGSTALTTVGATTMTLSDASGVNVSDVLEFGDELVLVTDKSADAEPVLTVSRGYYNTTPETHAANDVGHANPPYPRARIHAAIKRSFARMEALGLPAFTSATYNRTTDKSHVVMPAGTRKVVSVAYYGTDGRLWPVSGWELFQNVPSTVASTGNLLNVGRYVANADDLEIVSTTPYRWSSHPTAPVGTDTMTVLEGTEDIPVMYAVAWMLSNREISRTELDRSEEWGRTEQLERGQTGALVRAKWQEFYRALDEARRLNPLPTLVEFRRRPRIR